jgi:hypothetical protein
LPLLLPLAYPIPEPPRLIDDLGQEKLVMRLWAYHPSGFQVDAADLVIDPSLGEVDPVV